jgi:hypothetical protein
MAIAANNLYAQMRAKAEWKHIGMVYGPHGEKAEMYDDSENIRQTPEGYKEISLKQIGVYESEQEKQKVLQSLKQNRQANGLPLEAYERYAYTVMLVEFDCKKKLRRYPCILDYDAKGGRIGSKCILELPWEESPEESMAKFVFDVACSKSR